MVFFEWCDRLVHEAAAASQRIRNYVALPPLCWLSFQQIELPLSVSVLCGLLIIQMSGRARLRRVKHHPLMPGVLGAVGLLHLVHHLLARQFVDL